MEEYSEQFNKNIKKSNVAGMNMDKRIEIWKTLNKQGQKIAMQSHINAKSHYPE